MICQECNINEATVHVEQNINNETKSIDLCQNCANKMTINSGIEGLENFFLNFVDLMFSSLPTQDSKMPVCENCHMTFEEYRKNKRLGCSHCYQYFNTQIEEIFKTTQRGDVHQGKRPKDYPTFSLSAIHDEESENKDDLKNRLEDELKRAVALENYEEAALLRDQIKELERKES